MLPIPRQGSGRKCSAEPIPVPDMPAWATVTCFVFVGLILALVIYGIFKKDKR